MALAYVNLWSPRNLPGGKIADTDLLFPFLCTCLSPSLMPRRYCCRKRGDKNVQEKTDWVKNDPRTAHLRSCFKLGVGESFCALDDGGPVLKTVCDPSKPQPKFLKSQFAIEF